MDSDLHTILNLVGDLRDENGETTARERFRAYLRDSVSDIGVLQDFVQACLTSSGQQYNRALQDIINRVGEFLGFAVTYGRYSGVSNDIGFDGHWVSPASAHIVAEVKTTDVYAIRTSALLTYINDLVSVGKIPRDEPRMGLYIVGRPDSELNQLENAILAEGHQQELRVISADSLLALAGLAAEYDVPHAAVVEVLFPSGPRVDATVDLMASLVAQAGDEPASTREARSDQTETTVDVNDQTSYYLTPINWKGHDSPLDVVGDLLSANKYAFSERTPMRKRFKAGDWIAFYGGSGYGVFAHARFASAPQINPLPALTRDPDEYPWTVDLDDVSIYEEAPVAMTREVRAQLDICKDADLDAPWGWLVTPTRQLTEHDFRVLTRHE